MDYKVLRRSLRILNKDKVDYCESMGTYTYVELEEEIRKAYKNAHRQIKKKNLDNPAKYTQTFGTYITATLQ